jgi:hypothetical protein
MRDFHNDTLLLYKYFTKKIQLNIKRCKFKNCKKNFIQELLSKKFKQKTIYILCITQNK